MRWRRIDFLCIILATWATTATTTQAQQATNPASAAGDEKSSVLTSYGPKGSTITSRDGNYLLQMQIRIQFRYAHPFDGDPRTADQFDQEGTDKFNIRRARLKLEGHAYRPWLEGYFQYDLKGDFVRNLRVLVSKYEALQFKAGLDKADYSRERVTSSGRQQFAERSIVNREFTIDRQEGIEIFGRFFKETNMDSQYYLGVFTGAGRGGNNDDDDKMWMARYAWNIFRIEMPFSSSDIEYHENPGASLAIAAVTNRSRYTRFDTDIGGGQLDGFDNGEPGQYRINQLVSDLIYKHRGFSLQGEYHWKEIDDLKNRTVTRLKGAFIQGGYFLHGWIEAVPKGLELAFRYAFVDPDTAVANNLRQEYTAGLNWFFAGHNNKLSLDFTNLTLQTNEGLVSDQRVRFQWDVSF